MIAVLPTCPPAFSPVYLPVCCYPAYLLVLLVAFPPTFLSACGPNYLSICCCPAYLFALLSCLAVCLFPVLTIRSFIGLFDALPIWLSFCLLSSPTIDFSTSLRFCLFFHLYICLTLCLSVFLSANCLSFYLPV